MQTNQKYYETLLTCSKTEYSAINSDFTFNKLQKKNSIASEVSHYLRYKHSRSNFMSDKEIINFNQNKKINLCDVDGNLFSRKIITIDTNNFNLKPDGLINFGGESQDYQINLNKETKHNPKMFSILFEKSAQQYFLIRQNNEIIIYYLVQTIRIPNNQKVFVLLGNLLISILSKRGNLDSVEIEIFDPDETNKNPNKNYSFFLDRFPITIGRSKCDINLNYKCISQTHCTLELKGNMEKSI